MTLTHGIGPFAKPPGGVLNFDIGSAAPAHVLYLHDVQKRIRGELAGQTVVDTRRATLLHETRLLPVGYYPLDDIRDDLLVASDHSTHCPFKGDARYWHLRVGDRTVENALWNYPRPLPGAPPIAGLGAFYFKRLDAWYEEDERILGQRDPFHRVDTRRSSRHVVVRLRGAEIADSSRPVGVYETGVPVRWYLPREDVRMDLLTGSDTTSVCPYKGVATYLSYAGPGEAVPDVAWTYEEPLGEVLAVGGYLSFWGDDVEVVSS